MAHALLSRCPLGLGASAPDRCASCPYHWEAPTARGGGQDGQRDELLVPGLPHPVLGNGLGCGEGLSALQTAAVSLRAEVPREGRSRSPKRPAE